MIETFDAFISYKHAPLDNKIAEEVQRSLEHYHVPAKLKEKLNKKKIERIFRDKSELPITSSLSENISNALENSDFLIVICSHSTKLSGWVPREIEYFLKFHPISHVLTVLAEGEPDEVLPKQLLETTIIKKDEFGEPVLNEKGEPEKEVVDLEPLSCDYRLPLRTARRKELPRLVAAILGCSYDELVMRARQYRRRRNAIIITAALIAAAVAIGYLLWSRQQIQKNFEQAQENLRQAQINQSIYLANASERVLLQEHDGVGAAQLALEALPKDEEERPVVPEALYALSEAVCAYIPENASTDWLVPIKKYSMNSPIKSMETSEDGNTVFLLDESGEIAAFDIETQNIVFDISFTNGYWERMSVLPIGNEQLLISDGFNLHLYDWKIKNEIWNLPLFRDKNDEDFLEITMDSRALELLQSWDINWDPPYPPVAMSVSPDGRLLALDGANDVIRFIDIESGMETERVCAGVSKLAQFLDDLKKLSNFEELKAKYGYQYYENEIQKLVWSPDGNRIAAVYLNGIDNEYTISVLVYDLLEKSWYQFDSDAVNWEDLCFAGNDELVLMTIGGYNELLNGEISNTIFNTTKYVESSCVIRCFSLEQNRQLWETELIWDIPWEKPGKVLYLDKETYGKEAVFACIANSAGIIDLTNGNIINSNYYKSTILGDCASAEKSFVGFYMMNGNSSWLYDDDIEGNHMHAYYEIPKLSNTEYPIDFAQAILAGDGGDQEDESLYLLVRQKDCSYALGFGNLYDHEGFRLSGKTFQNAPTFTITLDDSFIVFEEDMISGLDIETGELLFELERDGSSIEKTFFQREYGTGTDQFGLLLKKDDEYSCMLINIYDGSTEILPIHENIISCCNGCFFWIKEGDDEDSFGSVMRYHIEDRSIDNIEISGPENESILSFELFQVSNDGSKVLCRKKNDTFDDHNQVYLIDLENQSIKSTPNNYGHITSHLISSENNCFAVESNTMITIYSMEGEVISQISTQGRKSINMNFVENYLYVYYNNGKIFRYRISDGAEDGVSNESLLLDNQTRATSIYRDEKMFMILDKEDGQFGSDMATIDLNTMGILNKIENGCGYSISRECYIVYSKDSDTDEYVFYSFPVYAAKELIQKGKNMIGDSKMTTETKAQYGLIDS